MLHQSDLTKVTEKVLEHHMGAFAAGVDEILMDYTEQSVIITSNGVFRGLSEIRKFFRDFIAGVTPEFWESYVLVKRICEGEFAFITWTAKPFLTFATDTFVVRDGKVIMQTFASLAK